MCTQDSPFPEEPSVHRPPKHGKSYGDTGVDPSLCSVSHQLAYVSWSFVKQRAAIQPLTSVFTSKLFDSIFQN